MSDWYEGTMEVWVQRLASALDSKNPNKALESFFLDFEEEIYNRALTDAVKNISSLGEDIGPIIGKLMSLRLSKIRSQKNQDENILAFPPSLI